MKYWKLASLLAFSLAMVACSAEEFAASGAVEHKAALEGTSRDWRDLGDNHGGQPWDFPTEKMGTIDDSYFGRTLGVGKAVRSNDDDYLFVSETPAVGAGAVYAYRLGDVTTQPLVYKSSSLLQAGDSFGYDFVVGNFCGKVEYGEELLVGAPTESNNAGAVYLMIKGQAPTETAVFRRWGLTASSSTSWGFGMHVAAGDLNGDGKTDLAVQRFPLDPLGSDDLPAEVLIFSDICSRPSQDLSLADAVVLKGESPQSMFGDSLQIVKLGGKSILAITDLLENDVGDLVKGAAYLYEFNESMQPNLRQKFFGHTGGGLSELAFGDLDGDGELDIVVGEPKLGEKFKVAGGVFVYRNIGGVFDTSSPIWSAFGGNSYANFGHTLVLRDVNHDGVLDLIVGAIGQRTTDAQTRSAGVAYLFMGTKGRNVFLPEKFWSYSSDVPLQLGDSYAASIAIADFDKKGWLDIAIGAPNTGENFHGRIEVMLNSEAPCFTADHCFINNKCIENGALLDDDACLLCDISKSYLEATVRDCGTPDNPCLVSRCDSTAGCVDDKAPDDTVCGDNFCGEEPNELSKLLCRDGTCKNVSESCGNYICSQAACLQSCSNDSECHDTVCIDSSCVLQPNRPPVANAGADQSVLAGSSVQLDGSASSDPDGDTLTYTWTSSDSSIIINNANSVNANFIAPSTATSITITLEVSDGEFSHSDTMTVTVNVPNRPPVANAGADQSVLAGSSVQLDGSASSDPDGDTLTYTWTSSDSSIIINNANSVNANFIAPSTATSITITLEVSDGEFSHSDTMTVTVNIANRPPIANAGNDQTVEWGAFVQLDGSASSDPDGDDLTYTWTSSDSSIILENADSATPSFIAPEENIEITFTLTVSDGEFNSQTVVTVIVQEKSDSQILTVIELPEDGATVSTQPTFSGTISDTPQSAGSVRVIDENGDVLCESKIEANNRWSCASSELTEGEHTIKAYYSDDSTVHPESDELRIIVSADVLDQPIILSPEDGSIITLPLVFGGTARAGSSITVNYSIVGRDEEDLCHVITGDDGNWSCEVNNAIAGFYAAQAVASLDNLVSEPSNVINFTIISQNTANLSDYQPTWIGSEVNSNAPAMMYAVYGELKLGKEFIDNFDSAACYLHVKDSQNIMHCSSELTEISRDEDEGIRYQWACAEIALDERAYELIAFVLCDDGERTAESEIYTLEAKMSDFWSQPGNDVRGGICSMAPATHKSSPQPIVLLLGFGLFIALYNRRRVGAK